VHAIVTLIENVDQEKGVSAERACAMLAPMFWGPRSPLDESCATIRE